MLLMVSVGMGCVGGVLGWRRSLLYVASMPNAPRGAVIRIARTATVRIMLPEGRPIAKGMEPIAAWTVALGM